MTISFALVQCACGAERQAEQSCPHCGRGPGEVDEDLARRRAIVAALEARDPVGDVAPLTLDDAPRLDSFRGASRFSTWAYKFALLEAAVKLRRRSWQGREVPLEPETWSLFSSEGIEPDESAEQTELIDTLQEAIAEVLRTSGACSSPSR